MDCLSILSINSNFFEVQSHKRVHTSIFTCAHYLLWSDLIHNNSPWKLFRPDPNQSNVSISMKINDSLQIFKDSISREILELTIVSKSWIGLANFLEVTCPVKGDNSSSGHSLQYLTFEFLHNSKLPANFWQDPASIDIQWVATIDCQNLQDPARNWQEFTNYAKTRMSQWTNFLFWMTKKQNHVALCIQYYFPTRNH